MTPEQAKELKQTILWSEFCKEVDKHVAFNMALLVACEPGDLKTIQESIKAYESVKKIPDNVIDREA